MNTILYPVHYIQTYPRKKRGGDLIQQQNRGASYTILISKETGWGSHPATNHNVKTSESWESNHPIFASSNQQKRGEDHAESLIQERQIS